MVVKWVHIWIASFKSIFFMNRWQLSHITSPFNFVCRFKKSTALLNNSNRCLAVWWVECDFIFLFAVVALIAQIIHDVTDYVYVHGSNSYQKGGESNLETFCTYLQIWLRFLCSVGNNINSNSERENLIVPYADSKTFY